MIIDEDSMITFHRKVILKQIFDAIITAPGAYDHLWYPPKPKKDGLYKADVNYYYENLSGDRPEDWTHNTWEGECEYCAKKWYGD